ncbi:MAG: glycosyltransferase [Puia sp.]|nr:glycosyltransferase [Puia sp.]
MSDRIPLSPPFIAPVCSNIERPLWSVMIPCYNCTKYLRETIESVLVQDPGPDKMQIEVVDDCSTDADVEALVAEVGRGRVRYFRQPENRGSLRNFETCINRSIGHRVHILHGDDLIKPGYYDEIEKMFGAYPDAAAAFTGYNYIDENGDRMYDNDKLSDEPGIVKDWLSEIAQSQKIQSPSIVVKRSVYEEMGSFYAIHYGEDWVMWVKISSRYPIVHSPALLAKYRVHQSNITGRYFLSGQSMKDIRIAIGIIQDYLPEDKKAKLKNLALKNYSKYFAETSDKVYHEYRKPYLAMRQAIGALKMHVNGTSLYFVVKIYLKLLFKYKFNALEARKE